MRILRPTAAAGLCLLAPLLAQDVGSGPVSQTIKNEFVKAYFRNGFHILTSVPPLGDVRRFGSTGLVQEFNDAAKTPNVRYALVKADTSDLVQEGVNSVLQVYPDLYDYYSGIGPNTAGYPTTDTQPCPLLATGSCQFQIFNKNYALFVYSTTTINGRNFTVRDPFFTRWRTLGGIGGLGPATNAEETATSGASTVTATLQRYTGGALYNLTSGTLSGNLFSVKEPVFSFYSANGLHTGFLGYPTGEETTLPNGRRRQNFEGGAIEYEVGGEPVLRLPVFAVSVNASVASQRLNLGDTVQLTAEALAANGSRLEGRTITWISTNSRVLAVDPSGSIVTARAVGGGSANVTAVSEGKTSRALTFFVTAPCCQVGEGAPTAAIQQMFVDAVTRNRLEVRLPASSPVRRLAAGFVQDLTSADGAVRYLLAKPDSLAAAYVLTGALLARYTELNGPAGTLGYPVADATPAGRQVFEGGVLAGAPPQLVAAPILTRWAASNYELGPAGLPRGPAESVLSFQATLGVSQTFAGGLLVGHLTGNLAGRAFFVSGLPLARYLALGGPAGSLGMPVGDEFAVSGRRHQDFEGGSVEYNPGDAEATVRETGRTPQISATPGTVAAGSRIRIAAGGFPARATLRITIGNQPDFIVATETGAYAFETFVPANAPSGLVNLRAADVNGSALAVGSYLVQSASETLARVTKVRGDLQSGLPGARLPTPLRIAVKDENGNPLSGLPVRFNPSPGAQIEEASTVTDDRGEAQAFLRLPLAELPALATAEAGRQVVTFSARTQAGSLTNFPRLSQAGQTGETRLGNETFTIARKGALLTASAAILRHLQNNAELPAPNGLADPLTLNSFLKDFCVFDAQGNRVCDAFVTAGGGERNVNLWRLGAFVGGALDLAGVEAKPEAIRDLLARGIPVLLAFSMTSGDTPAGAHFAVAIGVASGGGILLHDPNPAFNRSSLDEFLNGFTAGGRTYKASLAGAVRFVPRTASSLGFLVMTSGGDVEISSPAGRCGFALAYPNTMAAGQEPIEPPSASIRFRYCDGGQPLYQMDLSGSGPQNFVLTDLGTVAGRTEASPNLPAAFRLTRPASNWTAEVQRASFAADAVLNAASFRPELAPGTLVSVFGSGLGQPGRETAALVDGVPATVTATSPFQVNLHLPATLAPGSRLLRIESPFGSVEQVIEVRPVAPGLFRLAADRGAVLNQNGTLNSLTAPAARGEVIVAFGTGFGATTRQGNLEVVQNSVTATVNGRPVEVLYAGAAPGFPGLYQVNLRLPVDLAPTLDAELAVEQAGLRSNPVRIAVQ